VWKGASAWVQAFSFSTTLPPMAAAATKAAASAAASSFRNTISERIINVLKQEKSLSDRKVSKKVGALVADEVFNAIRDSLQSTGRTAIPGFGTFSVTYGHLTTRQHTRSSHLYFSPSPHCLISEINIDNYCTCIYRVNLGAAVKSTQPLKKRPSSAPVIKISYPFLLLFISIPLFDFMSHQP